MVSHLAQAAQSLSTLQELYMADAQMTRLAWWEVLALLLGWMLGQQVAWGAECGQATYFTVASCRKEGNSGIMASGKPLDDRAFVCALPHRRFGGWYRVCRADQPSACVRVQHLDYGPGRGPRSRGVIVDLSAAAFQAFAPLAQGVIPVTVEVVAE